MGCCYNTLKKQTSAIENNVEALKHDIDQTAEIYLC
jgi:hypothetical protein